MSLEVEVEEGSIRKCLVKKWTTFAGYGFNLHAEKGKAGQFVGKVDDGSPAEAAGLKEGDRIVEVESVNIGNENHQQVVTRIKAAGEAVWLLVVDKDGDDYCKNNKIVITADVAAVKVVECPDSSDTPQTQDDSNTAPAADEPVENDYENVPELPPPATDDHPDMDDDDGELPPPPPELSELDAALNSGSADAAPAEPEADPVETPVAEAPAAVEEVNEPEPKEVEKEAPAVEIDEPSPNEEKPAVPEAEPAVEEKPEPVVPAPVPEPVETPTKNGDATQTAPSVETIPKMSAAEMRAALAKKKKPDPRKQQLSGKDKLKLFQNL